MSYYGATGYPTCVFDGTQPIVGGSSATYSNYLAMYNSRRNIPSPLTITFRTNSYAGDKASVSVTVKLEQSLAEGHVCHVALWEDKLSYGGRTYRFVERALAQHEVLTIKNPNEEQVIKRTFTLNASWNKANLGVSVIVQSFAGKTVLNARATELVEGVAVEPTSLGRVK
ncbi:MAG: Omp28-related outer membrane protein, partial [Candidatus Coatesbacteria bacterium]